MLSSDRNFYAHSVSSEVTIRALTDMSEIKYSFMFPVDYIEWSSDSQYLLIFSRSKNYGEVIKVENGAIEHIDTISNLILPIESVTFIPGSPAVLIMSQHMVSLIAKRDKKTTTLLTPSSGVSKSDKLFSYLSGKTALVYNTNCSLVYSYEMDDYLGGNTVISGSTIAIPSFVGRYNIKIINTDTNFCQDFTAYEGFLGISSVQFSPDSKLIAIGSSEGVCRVLVSPKWIVLAEFNHRKPMSGVLIYDSSTMVYEKGTADPSATDVFRFGQIRWSHDSKHLSTVLGNTLYVWDAEFLRIHSVLRFQAPITSTEWWNNNIVIANNENSVYVWRETTVDKYSVGFPVVSASMTNDVIIVQSSDNYSIIKVTE